MNLDHTFRNLQEQLLRAVGLYEAQRKQAMFADALTGWEMYNAANGAHYFPITEAKAYKTPRVLSALDLIVVHVTAVKGGFGVSKSRVKYWAKLLDAHGIDDLPDGLAHQLLDAHGNFIHSETDLAQRLALWERFSNVPYHQVALRNGDILTNHPLDRVSWHGNAGNVGVGFSVDCAPSEKLDEWMIETARMALLTLIMRVREVSLQPVIRIAPHRAYSASRRDDPGAYVWRNVIEFVVSHSQGVVIDFETKRDGGLPVPNTWDDDALFDAKGRRLAA